MSWIVGILLLGLAGLVGAVIVAIIHRRQVDRLSQYSDLGFRVIDLDGKGPSSLSATTCPPPQRPRPFDWRSTLDRLDWYQFEKLVALAYAHHGYRVERRGGANADGGIDLIARKPGEPDLAVQCKHWKAWQLGVNRVREFLGAMAHAKIDRGVMVGIRKFTRPAAQFARQHRIHLLDQSQLVGFLEGANCRFAPDVQALLNDPTKHCPKCEAPMVLRKGRTPFWGCTRNPACRYTMPL